MNSKECFVCESTGVLVRRCNGAYSCGSLDLQPILTKEGVNFSRVYLLDRCVSEGIFVEYT